MNEWEDLPSEFGKKSGNIDLEARYARAIRPEYAALLEKRKQLELKKEKVKSQQEEEKAEEEDGEDEDEDEEEDDDDYDDTLPVNHQLSLPPHTKSVSSLSFDRSGSRMISASHDSSVNYWDLAAMNISSAHPFRSIEPVESHIIHAALFDPSGHNVVVIPASPQAVLLDRDGNKISECIRGDPYLRDLNNTKGHVAELTWGAWNPQDGSKYITSSTDSTLRIWDIEKPRKNLNVISVKSKKSSSGKRIPVTTCAWSPDGKSITSTNLDGSLFFWDSRGPFHRPKSIVNDAHEINSWTSSIAFSPDNNTLCTRGGDSTLKLWDRRKLDKPLLQRTGLPSISSEGSVTFLKDGKYIATGISGTKSGLAILDKGDLGEAVPLIEFYEEQPREKYSPFPLGPNTSSTIKSGVVSVVWQQELNQLAIGTSFGGIHILFNPEVSHGGAMTIVEKAPKARHIDEATQYTIDPYAAARAALMSSGEVLRGGQQPRNNADISQMTAYEKGKMERRDPIKSHRPQLPSPGVWSHPIDNNNNNNSNLNSRSQSPIIKEDPREALLKYAERASKDPRFKSTYDQNQPNQKIMAEYISDDELLQQDIQKQGPLARLDAAKRRKLG